MSMKTIFRIREWSHINRFDQSERPALLFFDNLLQGAEEKDIGNQSQYFDNKNKDPQPITSVTISFRLAKDIGHWLSVRWQLYMASKTSSLLMNLFKHSRAGSIGL